MLQLTFFACTSPCTANAAADSHMYCHCKRDHYYYRFRSECLMIRNDYIVNVNYPLSGDAHVSRWEWSDIEQCTRWQATIRRTVLKSTNWFRLARRNTCSCARCAYYDVIVEKAENSCWLNVTYMLITIIRGFLLFKQVNYECAYANIRIYGVHICFVRATVCLRWILNASSALCVQNISSACQGIRSIGVGGGDGYCLSWHLRLCLGETTAHA